MHRALLCHEREVYDHIRGLQGKYIPVCLSTVSFIQPYYYDSGMFKHFLFMSYAGQPVFKYMEQVKGGVVDEIVTAFTELHKCHILHCDTELHNILYGLHIGRYTIVDLERAKVRPRQPLLFSSHSIAILSQLNRHINFSRSRFSSKV